MALSALQASGFGNGCVGSLRNGVRHSSGVRRVFSGVQTGKIGSTHKLKFYKIMKEILDLELPHTSLYVY